MPKIIESSGLDVLLIMGNQLFPLKHLPASDRVRVFMAEDQELCTYYRFHKHKIILFLAAMRSYADSLRKAGYDVYYVKLEEDSARNVSYEQKLQSFLTEHNNANVVTFEIEDKFMEARIAEKLRAMGRKQTILKSPMFLSSRDEFSQYLKRNRKPFMKTFYEQRRKDLRLLVTAEGKPVGGKWSFDEDNRERYDDSVVVPALPKVKRNTHVKEVSDLVDRLFPNHPGHSQDFWLPVTIENADVWLEDFLEARLRDFGRFEDSMTRQQFSLFHSVLSPVMNLGLLTPEDIVRRTVNYADRHETPLNSLEGFIRQVIGWREFIRGIYQNYSDTQDKSNFFGHERKLAACWYDATTGVPPLDDALSKTIKYGWNHHIERLMIIGCVMLLSQVSPREVHRWFMEMYVDSSDWVMGPNVYGMSQFSDGGIFATKPYVCGSNYILKMSDYKKGQWCEVWDGLYWKFVAEKFQFLEKNPRLSMMVSMWGKKSDVQKKALLKAADRFIERVTI